MVRRFRLSHWWDDRLGCVFDAVMRRVVYGGSGWIGEGIRIVVGCICRNVGAVEIVDGFAEGEFLVVGIG